MKKSLFKSVALVLASVMVTATLVVGGTVAYLQDTDSDVNVMTVGNVYIAQHEYERATNADGSFKTDIIDNQTSYVLQDFTQSKPLYPSALVTNGPGWDWDTTTVRMSQVGSYGGMQVFKDASNAVDKFVTVENTGKSDAYVRTLVAFELGDVAYTDFENIIMTSTRSTDDDTNLNQPWYKNEIGVIEVDGNNYVLLEFIYHGAQLSSSIRHENGVLPAGDATYPSLCQVYMKSTATNEDVEKIDGNKNGKYDILVLSQAVQTAGFENAKTALDTAFGKSAEKAAEWFGGVIADNAPETWDGNLDKTWFDAEAAANATAENPAVFEISTAEEFAGFVNIANTNSLKNVVVRLDRDIDLAGINWNEGGAIAAYGPAFNGTLDGGGHTIYNLGAANNWTYANALFRTVGHDVCIKNLTIEGANINNSAASGHNKEYAVLVGIVGGGTLTIENVTIRNSSVTCKNSAGILVGGMTEGAIRCKNVLIENCDVAVTSASGKGGAILGDGWSAHDYDYAGVYVEDVKLVNCTYTVAGELQDEIPLYNYVK